MLLKRNPLMLFLAVVQLLNIDHPSNTQAATPPAAFRQAATTQAATPQAETTPAATTQAAPTQTATTQAATTQGTTTQARATQAPTTQAATTQAATTQTATTQAATTKAATTQAETTQAATTQIAIAHAAIAQGATTQAATTQAATAQAATTQAPTQAATTQERAPSETQTLFFPCNQTATTQAATTLTATTQAANTQTATIQAATTEAATTIIAIPQAANTQAANTQAATTQAATTREPTTQAATTQPTTIQTAIFTAITQAATTQAATTQAATTQAPSTQAEITQATNTQAATTQAATTQAPTTQAATTQPTIIQSAIFTEITQAATTQAPTTQAATTQAATTQAPTTQAATTQAPTTQVETTQAATNQTPLTRALAGHVVTLPTSPALTGPAVTSPAVTSTAITSGQICRSLTEPVNGVLICSGVPPVEGTVCDVTCSEGFVHFPGAQSVECLNTNGVLLWSHQNSQNSQGTFPPCAEEVFNVQWLSCEFYVNIDFSRTVEEAAAVVAGFLCGLSNYEPPCVTDDTCEIINVYSVNDNGRTKISFEVREKDESVDLAASVDHFKNLVSSGSVTFGVIVPDIRKRSVVTFAAEPDSFLSAPSIECEGDICVKCPAGYRTLPSCEPCPVGTFNIQPAPTCVPCRDGLTSFGEGSSSPDQCLALCTVPKVKNGAFTPGSGTNLDPTTEISLTCKEGYRATEDSFTCSENAAECPRKENSRKCQCQKKRGRCIEGEQKVVEQCKSDIITCYSWSYKKKCTTQIHYGTNKNKLRKNNNCLGKQLAAGLLGE